MNLSYNRTTPSNGILISCKDGKYKNWFNDKASHQKLIEKAYLVCLKEIKQNHYSVSKKTFFLLHKHLLVAYNEHNKMLVIGNANYWKIPAELIRTAQNNKISYLYLMGLNTTDFIIYAIGGIQLEMLAKKGTLIGAGRISDAITQTQYPMSNKSVWEIHKSYFNPFDFYNETEYNQEISKSYIFQKIENETKSKLPFDFYLSRYDIQNLKQVTVEKGFTLCQLLKMRYHLLCAINDNYREKKISDAQRLYNYHFIANDSLFQEIKIKEESIKIKIDTLSHWILDRYVLSMIDISSVTRKWFAEQEQRLLEYKLKNEYQKEHEIINMLYYNNLVGNNADKTGVSILFKEEKDENTIIFSECKKLFRAQFPTSDIPTCWFIVSAIHCLELGLDSLNGSKNVLIDNGKCYLSYKHLQMDYLPKALRHFICIQEKDKLEYKKLKKKENLNIEEEHLLDLYKSGKQIIKSVSTKLTFKKDLPNVQLDLPPIEECANQHLFPPCVFSYFLKLNESPFHLKHFERFHYSSFLLDAGWSKETGINHWAPNFLRDGNTTNSIFHTKYAIAFHRKEDGNWEDGQRKMPYGMGCSRLISGKFTTNPENQIGCPFKFLEKEHLKKLLLTIYSKNPNDENVIQTEKLDEILFIAKNTDIQQEACSKFFKLQYQSNHSSSYGSQWRPHSPQGYFKRALELYQIF